jgi:hypothetical protein
MQPVHQKEMLSLYKEEGVEEEGVNQGCASGWLGKVVSCECVDPLIKLFRSCFGFREPVGLEVVQQEIDQQLPDAIQAMVYKKFLQSEIVELVRSELKDKAFTEPFSFTIHPSLQTYCQSIKQLDLRRIPLVRSVLVSTRADGADWKDSRMTEKLPEIQSLFPNIERFEIDGTDKEKEEFLKEASKYFPNLKQEKA